MRLLHHKGFEVEGIFTWRAFDTWAPFRLIGRINKQRPNEDDLIAAREFAQRLANGSARTA
ncbi:hypothetical protein OG749_41400 [Streptomyces nojiriensis]|uniref:hypothetical protein n=1 Tax=Streptomyces nojiriensis TaxID=66374 RepID=UPI002E189BD3